MRTIWIALVAAAMLLGGCQQQRNVQDDMKMQTLQKTVGRDRLLHTFSQITPPPMGKEMMDQPDDLLITWIKQVDDWTYRVLSSPVTGEMDTYAMREMRTHLMQIYSLEMAEKLIAGFYRYDPSSTTYKANSTRAMLNLRSEWGRYEVKKTQPAQDQYKISLQGATDFDHARSMMHHESVYQVKDNRLIIMEFKTKA
ncbi:hypothetical protein ACFQI7_29910 [Paenibacillus allorhizosphaerae]|uniref:DUF4362 domain-containing protein n=1 Tax=Paenibacillus allorhizosphaerae TaxID=2849866 RepID=A0ABM8VS22_9BACL|nr:hypothetical protein [Paenibacillus allorhizosphaerae]CAG7656024.1 hypothetical protein PAECIP111802_06275 [Paenibacillus allorhizosphaerae]